MTRLARACHHLKDKTLVVAMVFLFLQVLIRSLLSKQVFILKHLGVRINASTQSAHSSFLKGMKGKAVPTWFHKDVCSSGQKGED